MKKALSLLFTAVFLFALSSPCAAAEKETNYLLLGDSIAAGYGVSRPEKTSYGAMVAYSNGYHYQNDAVSGHTTRQLLSLIENNKEVREHIFSADIISISIGGNDYLKNNFKENVTDAFLTSDYTKFEEAADACYESLCAVYSALSLLNRDAVILLQNLYNPRTDMLKGISQKCIDILNLRLEEFAQKTDRVYLVDVASYTCSLGSEYFQADHIHPNEEGHYVIAKAVIDKLFELGLGTAEEVKFEATPNTLKGFSVMMKKMKLLLLKMFNMFKTNIYRSPK